MFDSDRRITGNVNMQHKHQYNKETKFKQRKQIKQIIPSDFLPTLQTFLHWQPKNISTTPSHTQSNKVPTSQQQYTPHPTENKTS